MEIIVGLLGGLGLFLFGMTLMGDSLKRVAGNRMKKIVEALTKNRFMGIAVGAVVTLIIQSSSATTVMVVGFVNAGIMNLIQATGIIMGANIGTTITAQLVAFNLDAIAPAIVGIAVFFWLFAKSKKQKSVLEIFIGFGILFLGMGLMKTAMSPLRESEFFIDMINQFDGTTLISYAALILIGAIFTAVVQSSSAVTGILIALASQNVITIGMAVPLILGSNIGTCITAVLSSIGATRTAKRAAAIHVLFNVIGVIIFAVFLRSITSDIVSKLSPDSVARQIANTHTIFNITITLLLVPFAKGLVKLAEKIIPKSPNEARNISLLESRLLDTPDIAFAQVEKEMVNMAEISIENYKDSIEALMSKSEKKAEQVLANEEIVNVKQLELDDYLIRLSQKNITSEQHVLLNLMIGVVHDIERISDHAENIAEFVPYRVEANVSFSEQAINEINDLHSKIYKSCVQMVDALKNGDKEMAHKIIYREEKINGIEEKLRETHIKRLNSGLCAPGSGVLFLDTINNMENVADQIEKVAQYIYQK